MSESSKTSRDIDAINNMPPENDIILSKTLIAFEVYVSKCEFFLTPPTFRK